MTTTPKVAKKRVRPKDKQREYNNKYYSLHKDDITKKKNDRYKTDAAYRDRARKKSVDTYRKHRNVGIPGELKDGSRTICIVNGSEWCAISEVAKVVGVSVGTVARWIDSGILPEPFREATGRRWRWFSGVQVGLLQLLSGQRMNKVSRDVITAVWEGWHEDNT